MSSDGLIAESEYLTNAFKASGLMMPIDSNEYLALLDYYCDPRRGVASSLESQMIVGLETPAGLRADVPALLQRPQFRHMHQMGLDSSPGATSDSTQGQTNYAAALGAATSLASASDVVIDSLTQKLSKALSITPADIDTSKPLHSYGVDSLLALELRSWFAKEFKACMAIFEIMVGASFAAVASTVAGKSGYKQGGCD